MYRLLDNSQVLPAVVVISALVINLNKKITMLSLRKHPFSNILKISPQKTEKFSDKNSDIFFHISAQIIDCATR